MSYLLLIVEPPGQRAERGRIAGEAAYASMQRFAGDASTLGAMAWRLDDQEEIGHGIRTR